MRKLIVVASVAAGLLTGCDQKSTGKRETLSEALLLSRFLTWFPLRAASSYIFPLFHDFTSGAYDRIIKKSQTVPLLIKITQKLSLIDY